MQWKDIQTLVPHQWVLIEAVEAHSESDQRIVDCISLVEVFPDSPAAMRGYVAYHRKYPQREFYFVHTDRDCLNIEERHSVGIRGAW